MHHPLKPLVVVLLLGAFSVTLFSIFKDIESISDANFSSQIAATYITADTRSLSGGNRSLGASFDGSDAWAAGDFIASGDYSVDRVTIPLAKNGNPSFNIRAHIYSDDSGKPGVKIGTPSPWLAAGSISGDVNFDAMNAPLLSGRVYWIVLESDRPLYTYGGSVNWPTGYYNCSNGNSAQSVGGSNWDVSCQAVSFTLYSKEALVPEDSFVDTSNILYVSLSGSDSNPCTQSQPCSSFDKAYRTAKPGQTVEIDGGTYGNQTINNDPSKTSSSKVFFRPTAGANVNVGEVVMSGKHAEFQNMFFGSYKTLHTTEDVIFRNIRAGWIGIYSSKNVSIIGGEVYPGPNFLTGCTQANPTCNYDPQISNESGILTPPTDILFDGVSFHGWLRPAGTDFHTECMQAGSGVNVTIRNSKFYDCATHDFFIRSWGEVNGARHTLDNWLFENNYFGATTDGYYSLSFGNDLGARPANVIVRNNSFLQGIIVSGDGTNTRAKVLGNIIAQQASWGCSADVYQYNIYEELLGTSGKCGVTDKIIPIQYVDRGSLNLRLAANSAAIDFIPPTSAGFSVTDIDGQSRPFGNAIDAGADEYVSASNIPTPQPTPSPVTGSCSTSLNQCNTGIFSDTTDTSLSKLWSCLGSNGGTTAYCSLAITPPPVNGLCSTTTVNQCSAGTFTDLTDTSTHNLWTCTGLNGGTTAQCSALIPVTLPPSTNTSSSQTQSSPSPTPSVPSTPPSIPKIIQVDVPAPIPTPSVSKVVQTNVPRPSSGSRSSSKPAQAKPLSTQLVEAVQLPDFSDTINSRFNIGTDTSLLEDIMTILKYFYEYLSDEAKGVVDAIKSN